MIYYIEELDKTLLARFIKKNTIFKRYNKKLLESHIPREQEMLTKL